MSMALNIIWILGLESQSGLTWCCNTQLLGALLPSGIHSPEVAAQVPYTGQKY